MKRIFLSFAATLVAAFSVLSASGQDKDRNYEPYPYFFVGVQGGAQATFTNCAFDKLITPIGAVSVGRFFLPEFGARINAQGWNSKASGIVNGENVTYKYKYVTTDVDLMFNLSNFFSSHKYHSFNVILLGGFGFGYTWDSEQGNNNLEASTDEQQTITHNLRVGLQFEANLSKHLGLNLELQANNLDDCFNTKRNGKSDWQAAALVGLTYKFGFKKKIRTSVLPVQAVQEYDNVRNTEQAIAVPHVEEKPKPAVVKEKEKTNLEVFFKINSTTPTGEEAAKVEELANWLKQHPEAKVTLTGYADAGTGTAAINRKVSEGRVNTVAKFLVEKYGVDASRISTSYKGDTVQPFKENDRNRAVIGDATE